MKLTQAEASRLLRLTTRQIRNLEKEGLPRTVEGNRPMYDGESIVAWFVDYKVRAVAPTTLEEAETRRQIAEAQLAELKLQKEQGKVLDRDDVEKTVAAAFSQFRSNALVLPQRWAAKVVGLKTIPQATAVLEEAMREALESLSECDLCPPSPN